MLANKWDMIENDDNERQIDEKELDEICLKYGLCGYFSCSAKTPYNIKKSVDFLINKILKSKRLAKKEDNIKRINPCLCICCIPSDLDDLDDDDGRRRHLLQNENGIQREDGSGKFRGKLSFSSNKKSPQIYFDDDQSDLNQKQSMNETTMNTFGIKDFEQETNRQFIFSEFIKMFLIIILFPLISIPQLFDFIVYTGYYTKKWLPPNFDSSNVKNRLKWDFLGTIIGSNSNMSNNQFNNIEKALSSRLFVKQSVYQLLQRFILCIIVNYCFVVQFILLYHYISNYNNNYQWLTSFECIGPSICWLIIVITMGIWFGYQCNLPDLNDEMLCYQNLEFKYEKQTETASVLNFFLSLNQFNINKVYNKDKYRNILINIVLILFSMEYTAIPSVLRFISHDNDINVAPSKSLYFLWLNAIVLNFVYSFVFLKIACNTTINGFRLLLCWYSSLVKMLNLNQSIQFDAPFLSFENYDNIISWVELRGYLHYLSFSTFSNIEVWILLYMLSMIFLIILSIVNGKNLSFEDKHDIDYNCICIGAIYFCLLCMVHTLLVYWLGSTFWSLHKRQLKECNRQRLILNREILRKNRQYDIINEQQQNQHDEEEKEIDINESVETKYDELDDDEPIDVEQLSSNISEMQRAHNHLNDVIDFLKQHDFIPRFFGLIKLNNIIWISLIIIILTATLSVIYTFYLKK